MQRHPHHFKIALALAISAGAVLASFPFALGLDLRGGSQLTLEVKPTKEIMYLFSPFLAWILNLPELSERIAFFRL